MKRKRQEEKPDCSADEDSEDWCFVCKEGGTLMLCDTKGCSKVYHQGCVAKKKPISHAGERWNCQRHSCFVCLGTKARFFCLCCPNSVCRQCFSADEFKLLPEKKVGFCRECSELVFLAEEGSGLGSYGEKVDFSDRETYECLFKEYWEIIKEKEGLSFDVVCAAANAEVNKQEEDDEQGLSDGEEDDQRWNRKRNLKEQEMAGWASKPVTEFLKSIGKDTNKQLSQQDLESVIHDYIRDRNLFDPKTKKVLCDDKLRPIFRKKEVNKMEIYGLLGRHVTGQNEDNVIRTAMSSDHDILRQESSFVKIVADKELDIAISSDHTHTTHSALRQQSCFAKIVVENIKLVYLRRSLVEELMKKQPEKYQSKIKGSFVRMKTVNNNSHQLVQVEGMSKISRTKEKNNEEAHLQVFGGATDGIPVSMLSDCEFTDEECQDLRRSYLMSQLLRTPTVGELEQKARDLHEDITKHWIEREMVRLQNCIDRANVKGQRRELCEYLDKIEKLKQPLVQERLLKQVPEIIAEADSVCYF